MSRYWRCTICQKPGNENGPCGTPGCRNYVGEQPPWASQTTGALERGFIAGWEARGRHDDALAVEDELRLRREAEEARMRSEEMRQQAAQQQGRQLTEAELREFARKASR